MADVEERLADYCNDRRLSKFQFSPRPDAKWKLDLRPAKYNVAEVTPFRFCRYFGHDSAGLVARSRLEDQCECRRLLPLLRQQRVL